MEGNEWADVCLCLEHNPSSLHGRTRALRGTRSARMNKTAQGSGEMGEDQRGGGGTFNHHAASPNIYPALSLYLVGLRHWDMSLLGILECGE